ncbi:MAG: alpha-N-arabinofuranosidase, partial [Acidobacteriia bacterium]|nr:alpha-N-arabinofuranosidase [Terriglobia bacterium]
MPALFAQSPATLKVDLGRPKSPVSPTLYGLMTEEINYSYDGGLYAELIRNRTFRSDWSGVLNWFLIEKGTSSAKVSVDSKEGPSAALTSSAKLEVTRADANSPAGLLNEGYWGIVVRPNARYTGSFFAKTNSEGGLPLKVALVADLSGQVLASASVPVAGTAWKEYKFEMQSANIAASSENHLEITLDKPATPLAATGLPVPADVPWPAERQPDRHHGKAGRDAFLIPALSRRQLPGGRT